MKQPVSTGLSAFFNYAGKVLLTLIVVFVFLFALQLVLRIHALFLASQSHTAPPIYVGDAARYRSANPDIHPFWPEFPRNSARNAHTSIINGVQIITEEWQCSASPADVLAYYREQMTARGWQDVTEETYGLKPEGRESAYELQDETYLKNYRNVLDSNLVLSRGQWNMHVGVQPGKGIGPQTAVRIYAAAAPSITEFFEGVGSSLVDAGNQVGKPLEAVQEGAGGRYHTTIQTRKKSQAEAFQEALADLQSKGWKPLMVLPRQQARSGYTAWLVKGSQYAALSVSPSPQGQGSSVAFTEVTPSPGH